MVSHQLALGKNRTSLCDDLDAIHWERVVEIHVAGGILQPHPEDAQKLYYLDAHDLPVLDETWMVFRHILQKATQLKAVCFECESSDAPTILWMLNQVRERVMAGTANDELRTYLNQRGVV